jgi:hypothetical protein
MPAVPDESFLRDWKARGWQELTSIWKDLVPEVSPEGSQIVRKFRKQVITASQAGTVFERWVVEAFRLSGAEGQYPYEVPMTETGRTKEQIDGIVYDGWQGFLIESKCQEDPIDFGPIALLNVLVEKRVAGTLGLFFSVSGYTAAALESVESLRPIRVLLFDGDDLTSIIQTKKSMMEMVRRKWVFAVQYGRPNFPLSRDLGSF